MRLLATAALLAIATSGAHAAPTLVGWASLPAATFVPNSPASGQFIGGNTNGETIPFSNQTVQGVSAILKNGDGTFKVLQDNGFGTKGNSQDAILYNHDVRVDFRRASGGSGTVEVVRSNAFTDTGDKSGFTRVADQTYYPLYNGATNSSTPSTIEVAAAIKAGKLLTGADYDPESIRRVKDGSYYVGEEFGPFLLHFDKNFNLIEAPIALPGVNAPENPFRGTTPANLGSSRGFEGMALNLDGTKLYTLLEGSVTGDPAKTLRINVFDLKTKTFTGEQYLYKLDALGTNIGDMTAIGNGKFLVLERDGTMGPGSVFKRVELIDLNAPLNADGTVHKVELLNELAIADPNDLNRDGSTNFTLPFVTIEDVIPVDARTLLIGNDNNYPFSSGRTPGKPDNSEFALIRFDTPLFADAVPEPAAVVLFGLGALGIAAARRKRG